MTGDKYRILYVKRDTDCGNKAEEAGNVPESLDKATICWRMDMPKIPESPDMSADLRHDKELKMI